MKNRENKKEVKNPKKDYEVGYGKPPKEHAFSKDNQPAVKGRKGKSTTEYLKELGEANTVEFSIKITDQDGKTKTKKGKVESKTSINALLANLLLVDAIKGNHKARKEILDRTEGKSQQHIDLSSKGKAISMMTEEEREKRLIELSESLSKIKK